MMPASPPPAKVLLLPGWLDSGATHWQSHWERLHGHHRVVQDDWVWPRRGDWMARLENELLALTQAGGPKAVLVAHSLGCVLVAAWAAHTAHANRVACALMVAPPDTERDDMPPNLFNWRPLPRLRLPFASLMLSSSDDPFCHANRARQLAADWGCQHQGLGALGHLNGDSGLGAWADGHQRLTGLIAANA